MKLAWLFNAFYFENWYRKTCVCNLWPPGAWGRKVFSEKNVKLKHQEGSRGLETPLPCPTWKDKSDGQAVKKSFLMWKWYFILTDRQMSSNPRSHQRLRLFQWMQSRSSLKHSVRGGQREAQTGWVWTPGTFFVSDCLLKLSLLRPCVQYMIEAAAAMTTLLKYDLTDCKHKGLRGEVQGSYENMYVLVCMFRLVPTLKVLSNFWNNGTVYGEWNN